ncbi:MAG: flagellar basal body P-ring formation chaperone FlgA [Planctomycetaceae bacterium]
MARYDESTTWSLHVKTEAVIASPLIRLRDVASPIDPAAPWWTRAGESIIGLMPLDQHPMMIDRARLSEAVARSTAVPDIRWSGASQVKVTFDRGSAPAASLESTAAPAESVAVAGYVADQVMEDRVPVSPSERDRIAKLIQIAVDRYDVQLREVFEIEIDPNQASIDALGELRQVDSLTWESEPTEGTMMADVVGMNSRSRATAKVAIKFSTRPLIVVARENFRRGHVLSEADLMLVPAGRNIAAGDALTDIADAVGLQVKSSLSKESPVTRDAIAPVTVVERGELVEVHVVGGGVTIATGAKTLASGAQGDLIPVETLEPRRKLMARVAGNGIVEIFTRPPRVR